MDGIRFDALARRINQARQSRRTLIRLLTGGSLGPLLGAVVVGPDHASSKSHHTPNLARRCGKAVAKGAGNGAKCRKGKRKCCRGSSCMRGTPLVPVKGNQAGRCYCNDGYEPDPLFTGRCVKIPPQCAGLGGACNNPASCCEYYPGSDVQCKFVDAQKGRTNCGLFGSPQCCIPAYSPAGLCEHDCECCGALRCQDLTCVPPPDICHGNAESCEDGEPCCPGAGVCFGGRCCLGDGVACPSGCGPDTNCAGCCAGYCRGDGLCGPVEGCQAYGLPCTTNGDCCNNVPCIGASDGSNRRCRYP